MIYKGYTVRAYTGEANRPGFRLSGIGVYDPDGKLRSIAQDRELAKRAIDTHTERGIWPIWEARK